MHKPKPIQNYIFTDHALSEADRRGIGKDEVEKVLANPEQTEVARPGRTVYPSKIYMDEP
jgi:hypothetical protein